MAAALPQSHRHPLTDGGGDGRTYGEGMFASVLVALAGQTESRDALVLAAQLADADATIVVAHVMATSAAPLTGGTEAAARRRAGLRDAGEEVYATLGPDPRVRYLPLSGMPFAEAVERAGAPRATRRDRRRPEPARPASPASRELLAEAPCPVVVAPYGHRFVRAFAPARITVACGPPGPTDDAVALASALAERVGADVRLIAAGDELSPRSGWPTPRGWRRPPPRRASRAAAPARWWRRRAETSTCWSSPGADDEILRQAACPVLVVPAAAARRSPGRRAGPTLSSPASMSSLDGLDEHRLARLIDAGRGLLSELDLETVLDRLLQTAADLTGARYVALGVLDEGRRELARFLTRGIDEDTHRAIGDLPRGRGILGVLIDDPRPLRLDDVGDHPRSYGFPPGHPPMRSFLGVPILIRGEAWGNLYLTEKAGGEPFALEDEEAVIVLADWAAIAIENAGLYRDVAARREELERAVRGLQATAAIARAIGGETELERILELVVKRGRALIEAHDVLIMLREGDELVIAAGAGHVHDRRCGAAAAGRVDGGPGAGRRPLPAHRRRGPRAADPARAARARPCLDRAPGPARLPRPEPRRARGLRPPRRRRRLHPRRRAAAGGLRRAGGDGRGHGQVGRGRPPAPLAGGGRSRAPPLGARAARRDAAGARRPEGAPVERDAARRSPRPCARPCARRRSS